MLYTSLVTTITIRGTKKPKNTVVLGFLLIIYCCHIWNIRSIKDAAVIYIIQLTGTKKGSWLTRSF